MIKTKSKHFPIKNNTIIILDWDNTLFPTQWVLKNKIDISTAEGASKHINYFSELDDILYKFLKKSMYLGKVIIITNAMPTWIAISSAVLPKTQTLLLKIKLVSARKNYQNICDMENWKIMAFKDEVKYELNKYPEIQNIISIGDAYYEYNALVNLIKIDNKKKILKSIKFIEEPEHNTLIDQLEVLDECIEDVVKSKKHLDLVFQFR